MTRSRFQPGPAEDHYHDTLGAAEETPAFIVDNGVDAPTAVTTLVARGADVSTPGQAALLQRQVVDLGLLNFDDFDVNRLATLGAFTTGTVVVRLFALPIITWDFDAFEPARSLQLGTAVGGDPANNGQTLTAYPTPESNPAYQGSYAESPLLDPTRSAGLQGQSVSGVVTGNGVYFANFYNGGTPLTQGQSHVYADVLIPAS